MYGQSIATLNFVRQAVGIQLDFITADYEIPIVIVCRALFYLEYSENDDITVTLC